MEQQTVNFFTFLKNKVNRDFPFKVKLAIAPELINKEDLLVKGDLNLQDSTIQVLPDNLNVEGTLYLDRTPIKTLPKNLKVGKNLSLTSTNVEKLPRDLEVGGYLNIRSTPLANKYLKELLAEPEPLLWPSLEAYAKGKIVKSITYLGSIVFV
jgi:hypothetical protein